MQMQYGHLPSQGTRTCTPGSAYTDDNQTCSMYFSPHQGKARALNEAPFDASTYLSTLPQMFEASRGNDNYGFLKSPRVVSLSG